MSPRIDLDELHWMVWCLSTGKHHTIRVVNSDWAKDFGVTKMTFGRAMAALVDNGSIKPIQVRKGSAPTTYIVAEPLLG